MITFSPLYTGIDSAVKFPDLAQINKSKERALELQVKAEEEKYKQSLKSKEEFMKGIAVDPVTTVSNAMMVKQAEKIKEYTDKWTSRLRKNEGELTDADKVEMQIDRNGLRGWQAQLQSNQDRYITAKNTKLKDTQDYYDPKKFEEKEQEFFRTGEVPVDILDVRPQSMTAYLSGLKATKEETTPVVKDITDATGKVVGQRIVDVTTKATKEQAQRDIMYGMSEEARLKQVVLDFDNWFKTAPKNEVYDLLRDYDQNKNGVVDPAEFNLAKSASVDVESNPITKWAINYQPYLDAAMGAKEGVSKPIPTRGGAGGSGTKFDWNVEVGAGHNRNADFEVKPDLEIDTEGGTVSLPDYIDFSGIPRTTSDARKISAVLIPDGRGGFTEQPLNEGATFDIITYSPSQDVAVIKLKDNTSKRTFREGRNLVVKGSEVSDLLKRKPFGINRESLLPKSETPATSKTTGTTTGKSRWDKNKI